MSTRRTTLVPGGDLPALLRYWSALDVLYAGFDEAARRVRAATGQPVCVSGCGLCCEKNTIHCYGVEAEYIASFLLGTPSRLVLAIPACRDWLTRKGKYTYGGKMTPELWDDLVKRGELMAAQTEDCPFLLPDKNCLIHDCRPVVCRAYGVTRLPARACKRPRGVIEDEGSRAWWDGKGTDLPLHDMLSAIISQIAEPRYSRQGFLPMMLFERFRARELAGLLDDGKVPLVKMAVGIGAGYNLLWQEDIEATWSAIQADMSIATSVPLAERDGSLVMVGSQSQVSA